MERLALITIILPFVGAFIVGLTKTNFAKLATFFAALTTVCTSALAGQWYLSGHQSVTYDLVAFDHTVIFGVTLDAVSTLIGFAVVSLGFLICLYSCGYLTDKNREHPHNGLPRFYAFLLIFIGAMAGLVLSSTLAGQLLFFEITGGCSWALISYYQSPKAMAAAMKALIITHVGAIGLYIAAAYLFSQSGTFSITALEQLDPNAKSIVLFGVMFAAGFELGNEYSWITILMVIALIESTATFVWLLYKFGQCVIGQPSDAVAKAQPITLSMYVVLVVLMVMSVCSGFIAAYWLGLAG